MTLPQEFSHFHSAWESSTKADRTMENLLSRLMVEESRINVHEDYNSAALTAKKNARKVKPTNKTIPGKCFLCKKPGHWKKDCYIKGKNRNGDTGRCFGK